MRIFLVLLLLGSTAFAQGRTRGSETSGENAVCRSEWPMGFVKRNAIAFKFPFDSSYECSDLVANGFSGLGSDAEVTIRKELNCNGEKYFIVKFNNASVNIGVFKASDVYRY